MFLVRAIFISLTFLSVYLLAVYELINYSNWILNAVVLVFWNSLYFGIIDKLIQKKLKNKT